MQRRHDDICWTPLIKANVKRLAVNSGRQTAGSQDTVPRDLKFLGMLRIIALLTVYSQPGSKISPRTLLPCRGYCVGRMWVECG